MSMVIAHNIPALQTYNIVNTTSNALQKSIAKLSSGLRINSAADDAAGLAISEKMRAQVKGLDRAVANTQDGISLIQTAEGALQETHSILQRMRELSVQAANDTLTQQDRSYIQVEMDQLKEEVTRIGNTTQFNKKKLLNGDSAALWSSDDLETKAIINGGLREVDQFGQKKSVEGNYIIRVKADPGQAEVQKSDIMKVKHDNVLMNKMINEPVGVKDVTVEGMAPGKYDVAAAAATKSEANVTASYGIGGDIYETTAVFTFTDLPAGTPSGAITLETTDGTTIWAGTPSATELPNASDGDAQAAYLLSKLSAIKTEAKAKGFTIDTSDGKTWTVGNVGSTAPGLELSYAGNGATSPTVTNTVGDTPTDTTTAADVFTLGSAAGNNKNASVLFEVTGIDTTNNTVTLKATATMLSQSGVNSTASMDNIVVEQGKSVDLSDLGAGLSLAFSASGMQSVKQVGGKFVAFTQATDDELASQSSMNINIAGSLDTDWDEKWGNGPFNGKILNYRMNSKGLADTEVHFKNFLLNEKTGEVTEGDITLYTNESFTTATGGKLTGDNAPAADATKTAGGKPALASFDVAYIGKVAKGDVKLRDLDKFWNSEGTFMLDDSKTLTLNQGDGKTASITLYANDTLDEVATKINDAIASGLGQGQYVDDATQFATFVSGSTKNSEAVAGTFVIRSVVPGASGEITFSGDQDVINALSLNTIQESKETTYSVDAIDAHTGQLLKQGVKTTGNVAHRLINDNVDVEFSALKGVSAKWNDSLKKYTYTSEAQETTLHLADNTTVLQVGANEGEDIGMNIGDMRAHALGLDGVNVMSHDRAARSITIIDNAIDKVSTQRANLGAYQNRLEYTASNLTTASENLTSAESRIRDTDMAREMMEFTKLNIMLQAGNSMLAQANQQPQNVLSLIR